MRLVLYIFLFTTELQINIIPFKVVPLGSYTLPEMLLPFPVAVLEVFMWKCSQMVCHNLPDVVRSSKMTTFEAKFEFREKDSDQVTMGNAEPLEYPPFFLKKILSRRWQCDRERCRDAASKCPQSLAGEDGPFF